MAVVWQPNLWTGELEPTLEFGRGFPCVGHISVHVKEGRRIACAATSCVELSLGSVETFRTKFALGNEPKWDEKFDFVLDGQDNLEIRVVEANDKKKGPATVIGQCSLPLHMLLPFIKPSKKDPGKHMAWFELTKTLGKSDSAGHVQLTFRYLPPSPSAQVDQTAKEKLRAKWQQEKKSSGSKIFGGSLADSLKWTETEGLPQVCVKTIQHIRETGMDVQGIFRIVGSSDVITKLKDDFENLRDVDMTGVDPHDAAGLLKMYVRELSEPLIPFSHYNSFLDVAAGRFSTVEEVEQYKILIASVPADRRRILRYLLEFLFDVTQHSANNRMVPSSLAVVFAPNLLRSENDSPQSALLNSPNAIRVVGTLIESFRRMFEGSSVVIHTEPLPAKASPIEEPSPLISKALDDESVPTLSRTRSEQKRTSLTRTGSQSMVAEDDLTLARRKSSVSRDFMRVPPTADMSNLPSPSIATTKEEDEEINTPLQVLTALASSTRDSLTSPTSSAISSRNSETSSLSPTPATSLAIPAFQYTNSQRDQSSTTSAPTSGLSPALLTRLVFTRPRSKTDC